MPKFNPVSLEPVVNSAISEARYWGVKTAGAVAGLPVGSQTFWGIPFEFTTPTDEHDLLVLAGTSAVEIEVGASGSHLVFAQYCE